MSGKVMVVDDSAMSRRSLKRILESGNYEVIEADDGMAALEKYFLEKPDLVMLDMLMKGMYGLEVLSKLREMDKDVRVVIVSADIQNSTREMAKEAGALDFINKPFAAESVLNIVTRILSEETRPNGIDREAE
ncbi:MAG TPA: response regulator [Pyrinomonadaceae bacterium]|nr:response regulator [Pyrinomonadaceae bacterium]